MYSVITGFILGIAGLQQQAALPGKTVLLILSSLAVVFLVVSFVPALKRRFKPAVILARALAGCCAGIVWASTLAYVTLSDNLPPSLENRPITVTGTIGDLPQATENGIRFTNSHTTSSVSTPSRYGLLTGQYPWRKEGTGIAAGDAGMIIRPEQYTMADMFRDAGYATGAVGKWHLGLGDKTGTQDWNGTVSPALADIGFDYSYIMAATGDRVPCVFIENGRVVDLDPSDPIQVSYSTPFEGEPLAKDHPELLRIHPSQGHDQAIVNGIPRIGYMKGGRSALWRDEDIADSITVKALDFIARHRNEPFFLYFGTNDIHVPRVPHERFAGKSGLGPRGDALLSFDETVGRVMACLEDLGLADNTLVILSSDNGPVVDDGYQDRAWELLGDHRPWADFRGGKYSAFEAGTRVPMIVSWGDRFNGTVSDALFSHIDFFASLAALIGAGIPDDAAPDSRNAIDVLTGKDLTGRDYVIEQNVNSTLSVMDSEGWKYIEPSDAPAIEFYTGMELGNSPDGQLYNVSDAKYEKDNLIREFPAKAAELKKVLETETAKGKAAK